ncbi:MAG: T9SS type A sorting domain-containing protein, partial [Bacteroidales bacterium]|nr:T9SS type A sorting domain-containing protein [Bacteroidales bacterium]
ICIILIGCVLSTYSQASEVSLNEYSGIIKIINTQAGNPDSVVVSDPDVFDNGDTVCFIQNKGALIYHPFTEKKSPEIAWGKVSDFKNTGIYGILVIREKLNDTIIFFAALPEMDPPSEGSVSQLIKINTSDVLNVNTDLTCKSWDPETGTGGVLVLLARHKIILNANINVTARGFKGASPFHFDPIADSSLEICATAPEPFYIGSDSIITGFKGESFENSLFDLIKGYNYVASGGGAGSGTLSGGGGGSNAAYGGFGGFVSEQCDITNNYNSEPGMAFDKYYTNEGKYQNRIFLGGGGGSGTEIPGIISSSGGYGGGIVIILTDTLVSLNNYTIRANGQSVTDLATGSGGGGGGAGCIVLDVNHFLGSMHLEVKGGNGGSTTDENNKTGPGGFGGAGTIWYQWDKLPDEISVDLSNGIPGSHIPSESQYGATTSSPSDGITVKKLVTPIRGFLFNFLAGEQHYCTTDTSIALKATAPKGGDGVYKFKWEISYEGEIWGTVPGKDQKQDYTPGADIHQAYFRRIVSSAGITDTSNILDFWRAEPFSNNLIEGDQRFCIDSDPQPVTQFDNDLSGKENVTYIWQFKEPDSSWVTIYNAVDSSLNLFPDIINSISIRRIVTSGICTDTSNTVNISILFPPEILSQPLGDTLNTGESWDIYTMATGTEPVTYQWFNEFQEIDGETDPTLFIEDFAEENAGIYYCIVTNPCGKINSDTISLVMHVVDPSGSPYTDNSHLFIYPNPASDHLKIDHAYPEPYRLILYDALGNQVLESQNDKFISLESLSSGTYIVRLQVDSPSLQISKKIIIKR